MYRVSTNIGGWGLWAAAVAAAWALTSAGCAPQPASDEPVALRVEAVVYGGDDRQEYFAHPDPALRALAASSSAALMDRRLLRVGADGVLQYPVDSFGELYDLCNGERFYEQPSLAHCSGTLVSEDLVLTSAHCLEVVPCEELNLVFGYAYVDEGQLGPMSRDDVYGCAEVVSETRIDGEGRDVDHAFIRLDRKASAHLMPATIHYADEPLAPDEPVAVIGFGGGLPVKIDSGAHVVDARSDSLDYFLATSDTFHGSSGSGVFDARGQLRGVLARGADDYIELESGCMSVRTDQNDQVTQREEATYAARALDGLCGGPHAGAAEDLCATAATAEMEEAAAAAQAQAISGGASCQGLPGTTRPSGTGLLATLLLLWGLRRLRVQRSPSA